MLAISKTTIAQFGQTQLSLAVCAAIEFHIDKKFHPEGWKPLDARKRIVAEWTEHAPHAAGSIDKACTYGRQLFGNVAFNARLETEAAAEGSDGDYGSTLIGLRHFVADELRKGGYGAGYDEVGRWATGKLPKAAEDAAIKKAHDEKVAADAAARADAAAAAAARDEQAKHAQAAAEKLMAKAAPAPAPAPAAAEPAKNIEPSEPAPQREPAITVGLAAPTMLALFSRNTSGEMIANIVEPTMEEMVAMVAILQARIDAATPAPEATPAPAKRSRKAAAAA